MTQEALKLALEALIWTTGSGDFGEGGYAHEGAKKCLFPAIAAIKKALAQTQEPVAWIHNFIDGGISIGKRPSDLNRHPDRWTALYKDPKPCPTCEALARTVMLDQTSHDTTSLERTWVGLTEEDMKGMSYGDKVLAAWVARTLKEKNT